MNTWEMTRRNITSDDERVDGRVMIRRFYEDGVFFRADVFVGGWRVGSYKTEKGAQARVAREVT